MDIITEAYVKERFPKRKREAHKGDFGKVLIFAGSLGMAGAAALSGRAASRSGAGLIRFLLPSFEDPIYPILQTAVPVATCVTAAMCEDFNEYDAIAAGSGLGKDAARKNLLKRILAEYKGILLLDADALNMVARGDISCEEVLNTKAKLIFTPHIGEAKRLLGSDAPIRTEEERIKAVKSLAEKYQATVLLKGAGTLICSPKMELIKNESGNPGMAAGGSGDALSGIIAAFAGQGLSAFEAAACGAFLHGKAGDLAAEYVGEICMNAEDIISFLPLAFKNALEES